MKNKRCMDSVKHGVLDKSMQKARQCSAQVLRSWETSAGFQSWSTLPESTLDFENSESGSFSG